MKFSGNQMKIKGNLLKHLKSLDSIISRVLQSVPFPSLGSDRSSRSILIVRPGGLGDLVLLTLSMRQFTSDFSRFTFLIETRSKEWAKFLQLDYVCYDKNPITLLFTKRFHSVVCTEQFFGIAGHVSRFLTAKHGELIGFTTNRSSNFFSKSVPFVEDLHESENFSHLMSVALNQGKEHTFASPRRPDVGSNYEVVVLGGFESESRSLNLEDWVYLIKKYGKESSPYKIVAARNDMSFARALALKIGSKEISTSFHEALEFVANANAILTVDSGFVHVASYFGIPAKVLFTSGNPIKWSPLSPGSQILSNEFECQPCAKFGQVPQCNFAFRCKSNLSTLKMIKVVD